MRIFSVVGLIAIAISALFAAGCFSSKNDDGNPKKEAPKLETYVVKTYEEKNDSKEPFTETIELPGASVHGLETTLIMSKLGSYIEKIGEIEGVEVDIGSQVEKDDVLAVLYVPEVEDELLEKRKLLLRAQSEVKQTVAAIAQAEAEIETRRKERKQAEAMESEKEALKNLREEEYRNIVGLVLAGTLRKEKEIEADYARNAAMAALESVQASIETANAKVKAAEANHKKTIADKESADASVAIARAAISRQETWVEYAKIKAPFKGVITRRMVDRGAFVRSASSNSGAMPLFEIVRTDEIRIVVSVPNTKVDKIEDPLIASVQQKAFFSSIGGHEGVKIECKITKSAMALDQEMRMMRIELHMKNPVKDMHTDKGIFLKPGMFGTVTVVLKEWPNLAVVPTTAVGKEGDGRRYVRIEENPMKKVTVDVVFDDAEIVGVDSETELLGRAVLKDISQYKE